MHCCSAKLCTCEDFCMRRQPGLPPCWSLKPHLFSLHLKQASWKQVIFYPLKPQSKSPNYFSSICSKWFFFALTFSGWFWGRAKSNEQRCLSLLQTRGLWRSNSSLRPLQWVSIIDSCLFTKPCQELRLMQQDLTYWTLCHLWWPQSPAKNQEVLNTAFQSQFSGPHAVFVQEPTDGGAWQDWREDPSPTV